MTNVTWQNTKIGQPIVNWEDIKMTKIFKVKLETHQTVLCNHSWEVHYPGILERCVKCKVYKWKYMAWSYGKDKIEIEDNDLKRFEFPEAYIK